MGRKPNPLIAEYFIRGPKLADNSNRYPHTCRACGESFPKGRIDSLTNHLTKKCPGISEDQRIHACLTLHGIQNNNAQSKQQKNGHAQTQQQSPVVDQPLPSNWTALETLAEVSRHFNASDKHDDQGANGNLHTTITTTVPPPVQTTYVGDRFEMQEQFTLQNPPMNFEGRLQKDKKDPRSPISSKELTDEEQRQLMQAVESVGAPPTNLSMAAAAASRLTHSLLDPELLADETAPPPSIPGLETTPTSDPELTPQSAHQVAMPHHWAQVPYVPENIPQNGTPTTPEQNHIPSPTIASRSVFRMETGNGPSAGRTRHSRAKFDAGRRKEVQQVRKIGACIRCRILRKNCSTGDPCDTCRKVLSPRIWRTGCVRTKLVEHLHHYVAGVQIVYSQNNINNLKSISALSSLGTTIEATHFTESSIKIQAEILEGDAPPAEPQDAAAPRDGVDGLSPSIPNGMIDMEKVDVPSMVENYTKALLPEFINRDPSHFTRVTLQTAQQLAHETHDDLLKRALELWGYCEVMDRERTWQISFKKKGEDSGAWVPSGSPSYTTLCLQLTAAAERKASASSKTLLNGMQRTLQDSKIKVGFAMFLTALVLLHCVEKSTWCFRAWDQENLRALWPLEKPPSAFIPEGSELSSLLRMLLGIRRALPKTCCEQTTGLLVTEEEDPVVRTYFQNLALNYAEVQARMGSQMTFSPSDSRSLELNFCSQLLLPIKE